jgi:hypothetical protein
MTCINEGHDSGRWLLPTSTRFLDLSRYLNAALARGLRQFASLGLYML